MKTNRRVMIQTSLGALATPMIIPRSVLGAGWVAPSEKPTVLGVGVGGIGNSHMREASSAGFQIEALCDIDWRHAEKTFKLFPQARRYKDFREALDQEGDRIDCLYCGTPDHTHTIVSLAGLRAGKHVCCVKPLARTLEEGRALVDAAREAKVATQITTSPATGETGCRVTELIAAGAIGAVRQVYLWSERPVWPQGSPTLPNWSDPIPEGFDWDAWLGPAAKIPFADKWPESSPIPQMSPQNWGGAAVFHPFNFRGWTAFGTGALGDMGCHWANIPYRALKLGAPTRVVASTTKFYDVAFPLASQVTYDYPARDDMPEVRLVWSDGGIKPPMPKGWEGDALPNEGVLYIGDQGVMFNDQILDKDRAAKFADVPKSLPRRGNVMAEWLEACRGGEPAGSNFLDAAPLLEFVLLGVVAIRSRKPVEYDRDKNEVVNNPEANQFLKANYQNGWSL
ncbi:MAG: Gfo/Idh/MocA family oxidoreductase [Planctomycetia bacterium]|nr:Gfo/Idh/MocA family oxidoreductase [Planctomycetia bacterium]